MRHRAWLAPAAFLSLTALPSPATAQEPAEPRGPPPVLQIYVESVKPGKIGAHDKVEAGWPAAFRKAKWPTHYLAITSMSGPAEAWFLIGYPSYAAIEEDNQNIEKTPVLSREMERLTVLDGELLSGTRGVTATYRPELSYRPENIDIATRRYFALTVFSLKPGYDSAFADSRKLVNAGHEKANLDEQWAIYQVTSGMPNNTYLLFAPMTSLREVDTVQENHKKPYQDALGESGRQQLRDFARSAIESSETRVFAFSPKMSYPPPEWIAADGAYWAPKPVAAAKP